MPRAHPLAQVSFEFVKSFGAHDTHATGDTLLCVTTPAVKDTIHGPGQDTRDSCTETPHIGVHGHDTERQEELGLAIALALRSSAFAHRSRCESSPAYLND